MSSVVPQQAGPPFDARALTGPVDRAAVDEFARQLRAEGRLPSNLRGATVGFIVAALVVAVIALGFLSTIFATFASFSVQGGSGAGSLFLLLPIIVVLGGIALVIVFAVRLVRAGRTRLYRLDRFARANAMTLVPVIPNPALPGMIFQVGSGRQVTDAVRGERPRFVEFGNHQYTTGSGKNQTTHRWGYVAVRLDAPLPHIVLDATSNNGLFASNLPMSFDRDQRLSLEGDFDEHFALYCPSGYERDALYLFTPDIMARFIDTAGALDVEIIDDWLFLYAKREFSTLDPRMWAWLFSVVGALLDKLAQWARWRDERLAASVPLIGSDAGAAGAGATQAAASAPVMPVLGPPPGVAPAGRRLRRRGAWAAIAIFAVFGLFWLLLQTGLLTAFLR